MPRRLEKWENELIIDHINDGLTRKETNEQLARRRLELREVLGEDVSIEQIRAVSAWIKIRGKKALQSTGSPTVEPTPETNDEYASVKNGPEHFNYNNERKERWRRKWEEFIDAETTPAERERMNVLCLPGKMCLEIPLYLRLGFRPENITGVEGGDEEAKALFRQNADRYGIRGIEGRMEELLEQDPTKYDVVSLDFPGQLSHASARIAQKTLLAPKALVLTNFMAKREQKIVQEGFARAQEMMRLSNEDFKKHGVKALDVAHQKGKEATDDDEFNLAQARTFGGLAFHSNFGYLRNENRTCHKLFDSFPIPESMRERDDSFSRNYSREDWDAILRREALEISTQVFLDTLERTLCGSGMPPASSRNFTFMLQALGHRGYFGTPFTMNLKSYRYVSQTEKAASPFESDFAVLHTPVREYEETRHTLSFLLAGASSIMQSLIDGVSLGKMYVRDKRKQALLEGMKLSISDTIHFDNDRDQSVCSIRLSKLFCDLRRYGDVYGDSVSEKLDKNALIVPRETIE